MSYTGYPETYGSYPGIIAGAGGASKVLRAAAHNNFISSLATTFETTSDMFAHNCLILAPDFDMEAIVLADYNFLIGAISVTTSDLDSFTIETDVIEYNGVAVPVTSNFMKLVNVGDTDKLSMVIPASAFGLEVFPANTRSLWQKRTTRKTNVGTLGLPYDNETSRASTLGDQSYSWNSATGSVGNKLGPGPLTISGTVNARNYIPCRPIVLGIPRGGGDAVALLTDSIGQGADTTSTDSARYGRGYLMNGLKADDNSWAKATINFGCSMQTMTSPEAVALAHPFYKYCTHGIPALGTNNVSNDSLAVLKTRMTLMLDQLNTGGINNIIGSGLMLSCSSTDSGATLANQTPRSGWGNAEDAMQFNSWLNGLVGSRLTKFFDGRAVIDPTNTGKWPVNGTANYASQFPAGIHPKDPMVALLKAAFRSLWLS